MEICYFSKFKAKSNLRKCTDSPEPSLIAEMRNNIEIRYFSIFEAQSTGRVCVSVVRCSCIRVFYTQHVFFFFYFFFFFFFFFGISEILVEILITILSYSKLDH